MEHDSKPHPPLSDSPPAAREQPNQNGAANPAHTYEFPLKTESLIDAAVGRMLDALLILDWEGNILYANRAAATLVGVSSPAAGVGRNAAEFIHPDFLSAAFDDLQLVREGRGGFFNTYIILRADGTQRWVEGLGTKIDIPGGTANLVTLRDISERKTMEAALRELSVLQRAILNGANYSIISTTPEGVIRTFNAAAERWLGYEAGEVVGKASVALIHDADELAVRSRELSLELGRPVDSGFNVFVAKGNLGGVDEREWTYVRRDGSRFPVLLSVTALRDETGVVTGYLGIASDITARKRAEEQLRKLWQAVEQSPASVLVTDLQGRIEYVNPIVTRTTGYPVEELMGQNPRILKSGETPRESYRELWETITSGKEWRGVFHNRKKNGDLYWESASVSPVKDSYGRVTHFVAVKEDITAIREAQESLRLAKEAADDANRAKSDFLASMSHEIRTPMNAIIGMAELLWETAMTPEQRQYVRIFRSAGENLLDLINDILDISKVEAGRLKLETMNFNIHNLLEKTCEVMAVNAHTKGIELACRISPDIPLHVTGDPTRLRQILLNLIGNAVKFTDRGEVVLEVCPDRMASPSRGNEKPVRVHFAVRDTGIGIPPDKFEQIFERFTQVDASTTRMHGGSGLGLTISKRLVELMNGSIWVESAPGAGSIFHFTVAMDKAHNENGVSVRDDGELKDQRILVIDDNATNRLILKEMIQRWGAQVTEADSGEKGLRLLRAAMRDGDPFRLAILDQQMPGMDGFDTARQIKHDRNIGATTLLMMTSEDRQEHIDLAKQLDISGYLVKPVKRLDLREALLQILGRADAAAERISRRTPEVQLVREQETPRPLRILLVDDSEDNRLLILAYLKKLPYTVDIAENGAEAVERVKKNDYDLILMDMQMPVMDGYTATGEIRKWEQARGAEARQRIIALTAHALRDDARRSIEAGCDAHLTKPVKKEILLQAIRDIVDGL
jgi:PAS domain S-box-containing protein